MSLDVRDEAEAKDLGLPSYPGAKPYTEKDDSSSGANLGLETPWFGFKVVALKLETKDEPRRVAAFYRDALSKYGHVLECADDSSATEKSGTKGELACSSDDVKANTVVYKVGREENQRIVAIEPHRSGTRFSLVHLDMRGESSK